MAKEEREKTAAEKRAAVNLQQFFRSLGDQLQKGGGIKTVYGEPTVVQGRTLIPVARVAYGFGGGSRANKKGKSAEQTEGSEGGGGGGFSASPVGVVEVTKEETRFVSVGEERRLGWALIIGFFLGILLGRRRSRT
ncbi:MAG: GerW family sporulation protein [Candidatus Methylomirabilales bacterium]